MRSNRCFSSNQEWSRATLRAATPLPMATAASTDIQASVKTSRPTPRLIRRDRERAAASMDGDHDERWWESVR